MPKPWRLTMRSPVLMTPHPLREHCRQKHGFGPLRGVSVMIKHKILFAIVFLCLSAIPGFAQNASLVGTIHDAQQAVIPGVTVTLANADTGVETTAIGDEMGNYEFPAVRPGNYSIKINKPGFQSFNQSIVLVVGQRARVDVTWQVGAVCS